MVTRKWTTILIAIIAAGTGITLIFNPLYLYPDGGGEPKITYHVSQIDSEITAEQALELSEDVLTCPGDRPCALERQVINNSSMTTDVYIDDSDRFWYRVVGISNSYYIPNAVRKENGTVLTLNETSSMGAIEEVAVPAERAPEEVRAAITTGSTTVHGEPIESFEQGVIYEYNKEFYYSNRFEYSNRHWTADNSLQLVRVLMFLFGSGLVAYSAWITRSNID